MPYAIVLAKVLRVSVSYALLLAANKPNFLGFGPSPHPRYSSRFRVFALRSIASCLSPPHCRSLFDARVIIFCLDPARCILSTLPPSRSTFFRSPDLRGELYFSGKILSSCVRSTALTVVNSTRFHLIGAFLSLSLSSVHSFS